MTHRGWALGVLMILFATAVSGCLSSDDDKEVPKTGADDDSGDAMDGSMDGDQDGDATDGDGGSGDSETPSDPIAPVAAFTINSTSIVAGDEVLFDANTTTDEDTDVADLTFAWDFGDGATATGMNTTHVFAAAGVYNVTLNVTDPDGLFNVTTQTVDVATAFTPGMFDTLTGTIVLPNPLIAGFGLYESNFESLDAACSDDYDCAQTLGVPGQHYQLFTVTVPDGALFVRFNIPSTSTSPMGIHVFRADTLERIQSTNAAGGSTTNVDQAVASTATAFDHKTWHVMAWIPAGANKAFEITAEAHLARPA